MCLLIGLNIFCLVLISVVSVYTLLTQQRLKKLIIQLESFYSDVIVPQLSVYETEYIKKEKAFDERINQLRSEIYPTFDESIDQLGNEIHPTENTAEILHPGIYNLPHNIIHDEYTIIGEEVAE